MRPGVRSAGVLRASCRCGVVLFGACVLALVEPFASLPCLLPSAQPGRAAALKARDEVRKDAGDRTASQHDAGAPQQQHAGAGSGGGDSPGAGAGGGGAAARRRSSVCSSSKGGAGAGPCAGGAGIKAVWDPAELERAEKEYAALEEEFRAEIGLGA